MEGRSATTEHENCVRLTGRFPVCWSFSVIIAKKNLLTGVCSYFHGQASASDVPAAGTTIKAMLDAGLVGVYPRCVSIRTRPIGRVMRLVLVGNPLQAQVSIRARPIGRAMRTAVDLDQLDPM